MATIGYLEGEASSTAATTIADGTEAKSSVATPVSTSAPVAEKKSDGGRKPRICVSVIKGEACRTQMEGKVCPYSHEGAPAAETLTRVYVCHLPLSFSNDDIQKLATSYGKIQESRILVDPRSNLSRGVAFIHYEKHEEAENAIKALNDLKLPGHNTVLAARYARRNRAGRRPRRHSRSRSPRRRRVRSPPRRRRPLGGRRRGYRSYDDDYEDDYDRRRPAYAPYESEDSYDPSGADRGYAPYGRTQAGGGGRSGSGYTTYTPPTVNNTTTSGAGSANGGTYGAPTSTYGYGANNQQNTSAGRVDGYRSYPPAGTDGYGAPARY